MGQWYGQRSAEIDEGHNHMKTLLAATALTLAFGSSAFGFDTATQAIIDRHKANKPVAITDVATLMRSRERWC
jgi:hypothetical protein